jgi:hypothetical protein
MSGSQAVEQLGIVELHRESHDPSRLLAHLLSVWFGPTETGCRLVCAWLALHPRLCIPHSVAAAGRCVALLHSFLLAVGLSHH